MALPLYFLQEEPHILQIDSFSFLSPFIRPVRCGSDLLFFFRVNNNQCQSGGKEQVIPKFGILSDGEQMILLSLRKAAGYL